MAEQYGGPVIMPLYGVAIRAVADSGDPELMKAMLKVSDHLMSRTQEGLEDWRAAHTDLAKAVS